MEVLLVGRCPVQALTKVSEGLLGLWAVVANIHVHFPCFPFLEVADTAAGGPTEWTYWVFTIPLFEVPERWQVIVRCLRDKAVVRCFHTLDTIQLPSLISLLIHCSSLALPFTLVDIPPQWPDCWGGAIHAKICQNGLLSRVKAVWVGIHGGLSTWVIEFCWCHFQPYFGWFEFFCKPSIAKAPFFLSSAFDMGSSQMARCHINQGRRAN